MKDLSGSEELSAVDNSTNPHSQSEPLYCLQDSRGLLGSVMMFWKEGGGYCSDIQSAELFTKERSLRQNKSRSTDVAWPADYLQSKSRPTVDCQLIRHIEVKKEEPTDVCVIQKKGRWDGNSIYFLCEDGENTVDLSKAATMTREKALEIQRLLKDDLEIFRLEDMQKIAFHTVPASSVSHAKKLKQPKPSGPQL